LITRTDLFVCDHTAGSEATSTAAISFCHALFLFPEVAQKVYEEIEAVTEGTRLPKVKDRGKMPYTEAVWKESFRWHPFLVFGAYVVLVLSNLPLC